MDISKPPDELARPVPTDYAATHCRNCAMGWTRIGATGGAFTVCLLDRERVMPGMTHCDRYELREALAPSVSFAA